MREFVARLIDTGMNRETAVAICRSYLKHGKRRELARYVEEVEQEVYGRVEEL